MPSITMIVIGLAQVLVILVLAPLLTGIIRKTKARTQKRIGASVLQPYYDLLKLVRKDEIVSDQASWIFRACPWVNFAAMTTAAFFIPVFLVYTPFGLVGDLLLVVGLFALGRFFTMLAGLDVASSFGGLGSSREMMISALLEPALFLSIFVVAITYGGTNLSTLIGASSNASFLPHPQIIFAAIGLFIIILGETGRLPFDNPATHLELTMVHETMILEYSGKSLALMEWSQSIKQIILFTLMVNIFVPWGISSSVLLSSLAVGFLAFIGKISLFGIFVAFSESSVAKWRLFRIPDLIAIAIATSMIGIVLCYL
ncbi:respiratory chain complex I subunit 1 family protein [Candidatus Nitrosotalea sp. FS]|uniref:respiratory chain complex I subunit 1 family protein n=1 Tax=Candidatus Nitrosotalea sp. FS TaxID=2341021 RepID=UPI00210703CA|nr:NADH-quinone oxidoreductase subunit H [Candidatus Nitrosotalea sp. FS]